MVVEAFRDAGPRSEQPMIAQYHRVAVAEVLDQALALLQVQRGAFVVVIGDVAEAHARLRDVAHEAAFHRGHRHAGQRVGVDHAIDVVARRVHRAVNHVAGLVDTVVGGVENDFAVDVDLDHAGGGHLLVQHAVGVDQELVVCSRHARRNVVGDHLGHAEFMHEPVAGGEIDACVPFFLADLFAHRLFFRVDLGDRHGVSPQFTGIKRLTAAADVGQTIWRRRPRCGRPFCRTPSRTQGRCRPRSCDRTARRRARLPQTGRA